MRAKGVKCSRSGDEDESEIWFVGGEDEGQHEVRVKVEAKLTAHVLPRTQVSRETDLQICFDVNVRGAADSHYPNLSLVN